MTCSGGSATSRTIIRALRSRSGLWLCELHRYEWRPPHVGSTFSFEELPAACKALQGGQTVGKVVVLVDETPQTSTS